jgi:hypothetical protein
VLYIQSDPGRLELRPVRLVGDKGYSCRVIRQYLRGHGIQITIHRKHFETWTGLFNGAFSLLWLDLAH